MSDYAFADCIAGAPHPKESAKLYGHTEGEQEFLNAYNSGRLHHAWMLTGPQGIGKASLSYRIAKFLLTQPEEQGGGMFAPQLPDTLDTSPNHPAVARIIAGSESGLFVLRRPVDEKTGRVKTAITVEETRKLGNFFALSAGGNGWRVALIDAVDDMNANAANAVLKLLEEPPEKTVFLLVTHQPSRILPTIRSRCRVLGLNPLGDSDLQNAFAAALPDTGFDANLLPLAQGSVGRSVQLALEGGADKYAEFVALMKGLPSVNRAALKSATAPLAARGAEAKLGQYIDLVDYFLSRLSLSAVKPAQEMNLSPQEADLFTRLAPSVSAAQTWAKLQQSLGQRARRAQKANLDTEALVLDIILKIEQTAQQAMN